MSFVFKYFPQRFRFRWCSGKESTCQCRRCRRDELNPRVRKIPGGGAGNLLQYSCLGNFMNRGTWGGEVMGRQHCYSSWSSKESDVTEHTHTSSFILKILIWFSTLLSDWLNIFKLQAAFKITSCLSLKPFSFFHSSLICWLNFPWFVFINKLPPKGQQWESNIMKLSTWSLFNVPFFLWFRYDMNLAWRQDTRIFCFNIWNKYVC